jgi:large subunit ribosomal protein L35
MPKLKTNRSVKKRLRITKHGKVRRSRPSRSHLLAHKRSKRKRHLGRYAFVAPGEVKSMKKILPYGA